MTQYVIEPIGKVTISETGTFLQIAPDFIPALRELDGFSHLNVLWWFDGHDNKDSRNVLEVKAPYKRSPSLLGTFATRSPQRPNPIALSTAQIVYIDHKNGKIQLAYIDADNESPVIDLKPYTPSLDRVENPEVPDWCSHWPPNIEESGNFDWENEFNF